MRIAYVLSIAAVLLTTASAAQAIPFGVPYAGDITIQIQDWDMGTVYPSLGPVGTSVSGEANVDAIAGQTPATARVGNEDTWGIAKVTNIQDNVGGILYQDGDFGIELTIMFYGEHDIYVEQIAADEQLIQGVGLNFAMYSDPLEDWDPTLGSAGRTGSDSYTTVTNGTKVLEGSSLAGFLNFAGDAGGAAAEFESRFKAATLTGDGQAYFEVTGGTDQVQFDTNTIWTPAAIANGVTEGADLVIQFDTFPPNGVGDWLVRSSDPVNANVVIPEPATVIGLLMGVGGLGRYIRKRRAA